MTDKKFTDEEIIKALECCTKAKTMGDCIELNCPFRNDWDLCLSSEIQKMALDLINRQKAENERLKKDNKTYKLANQIIADQRDQLDKDIDELEEEINALNFYRIKARTEAYKEFAEKLKEVCRRESYLAVCDIDHLLKEMINGKT